MTRLSVGRRPRRLALPVAVCAALAACAVVACAPSDSGARAAIRTFLAQDSIGHLAGDADLLASLVADTIVSVDGGAVRLMTREEVRRQFAEYFAAASIVGWDEPEAPRVRISPGGDAASINRAVHQTREMTGPDGRVRTDTAVLAWTAYLEREGGAWRMTSVATTWPQSAPSFAPILRGARRAVGLGAASDEAPAAMRFGARVTWAGPEYGVEVLSTPGGATQLAFADGPTLSVSPRSRWTEVRPDSFTALSDTMETYARGHDFFLGMLYPETRLRDLHLAGTARFEGADAILVTGTDAVGGVVSLYYARADTMPLGFVVQDHGRGAGPVTTTLGEWRQADGLDMPGHVRFRQGSETFDYDVVTAEILATAPDDRFERGAR